MALSLNTNIASLNAQRNLSTSQGMLETSLRRLSSGLRVTSAKDDAAGLFSIQKMTADIPAAKMEPNRSLESFAIFNPHRITNR